MNKRAEFTKGMESKIEDMATALVAVQDKFEQMEDVAVSGAEALAELQIKIVELKAEMQLATDLGTAKYLMQQIEELEKDIQLQTAINAGIATKFRAEIEELFHAFFTAHASAKTVFSVLDKEYSETMSIRTAEEDTAKMQGYGMSINHAFSTAKALLLDVGLADSSTVQYGKARTHLGQMSLFPVGVSLSREMRLLQRQLNI